MTRRIRALTIAALMAIIVFLPACYTLLKHPRLASMDYQRPDSRQCTNCHSSAEIWKFNHSNDIRTYAGQAADWSAYYDVPWWYERSWGFVPDAEQKKDKDENQNE